MPNKWRWFEILFPLRFNDGSDVPAELLGEAVSELFEYFGAASFETQQIEGHWRHAGVVYRDTLAKLVIDALDTKANRQ
jgi:hypothetical protein